MVNTLKLLVGVLLVAFGLVGIAVEIDNARTGKSDNRTVGIAMIIICIGGGGWLVRSRRRASAEPKQVQTRDGVLSTSNVVLRVAREQVGRLTAAEVAANTTISFDDAKAELDRLEQAGACTIDVGENGVRVYYFAEFANPDGKRDLIA